MILCLLRYSSSFGMSTVSSEQYVNVGKHLIYRSSVLPFVLLTLGKGYEHYRQDRNQYVTIFEDNIISGKFASITNDTDNLNETVLV